MSGKLIPEAPGPGPSPGLSLGGLQGNWVSEQRLPPLSQFWQLYNAVTLFELSSHEECKEWQVWGVRARVPVHMCV